MSFRNISAWSIRNPVPSIVLFFMLTVAGIVSFSTMEVNNNPDIDFPVVIVQISQPGAAPTELENQVTQKVESAVRSLQGIDEINSTVTEGSSVTVVQLNIGTPIDRAVEDVRSAVQQIRSDLPDGILEPQVSRANTSGDDLASYAAVGTDMTIEQLSWYIDNNVAKELLAVPGMATVSRNGGVDREIRVILDPAKLQSQGLTASQVNQQLRQVNLNAAGGRAEIAGSEQSVRVLGNAKNAYELGQTQIAVGGGRTVKLADIVAGPRSLCRAALCFRDERPPGAELRLPALQGRVGRVGLQGRQGEAGRAREAQPEGPFPADLQRSEICRAAISLGDGGNGRGRGARRACRVPVPARLALDDHLGAGHPALGDPDLLVHGPAGLQPEPDDPARAEPGGRRAGR